MDTMSEEIFSIIFFFIIIGTPFCGAEGCDYDNSQKAYVCKNIIHEFPRLYYGNYHLQCINCQIQSFDKNTFPHENTLKSFNVSHSGLQHIGPFGFSTFTSLEYLLLQNNGITNISENAFVGVRQLFELHIEENMIKYLHPGFLNGMSSNFINISHNVIDNLPPRAFKGSVALLTLDLSHNKIHKIDKDAFLELNDLEELDLSSNLLCHIHLGTFKSLGTLRRLNLSDNKLGRFNSGAFSGLKSLDSISLARNLLTNFDSAILLPMIHLRKLDVSGNGIYNFDANEILLNVPMIRIISLEDNIYSCTLLKNVLQYFRLKLVDVEINVYRYEHQNIIGIACIDGYTSIDQSISIKYFLKKSLEEANLLLSYC